MAIDMSEPPRGRAPAQPDEFELAVAEPEQR
jgi:hypothetical protein